MAAFLRRLIRRFDAWLSRRYGVFTFCDDKDCLIRLQIAKAPHPLHLSGRLVNRGEPVLMLHLWNEQVPPIPPDGPTLGWALQTQRLFIRSFRAVDNWLQAEQSFPEAKAVGGVTVLLLSDDRSGGAKLIQRLGFTILPYRSPLGRFGEFWENFYSWWLMWTYNPASLHHKRLSHLRRSEFWMLADEFLERFHEPEEEGAASRNT